MFVGGDDLSALVKMLRIRRGFPYKRYFRRVDVGIDPPTQNRGDFRESRTDVMKNPKICDARRGSGGCSLLQDILYRRKLHFAQMADSTHQLGAPGEKIVPVG